MKARIPSNALPCAWIVNPQDRGRKSIKINNKVYLKDGQNFEIELFNPLKESVLADIRINGKKSSNSGLVLRPGQRYYLDCFIDDKRKFIFNTYEIENTNEAKEAASSNGIVEVFFYKEQIITYYPTDDYYDVNWGNGTGNPYRYPIFTTSSSSTSNYILRSKGINVNPTSTYVSYDASINLGDQNITGAIFNSSIETGRVEKGEQSSQKFTSVNMDFESSAVSSVVYFLLPESQKPIETNDLNFCSNCAKKLKGKENFCPKCGLKLR